MHTFGGVLDVELAFAACDVGDGDSTIFFLCLSCRLIAFFYLIQIWYFLMQSMLMVCLMCN